MLGQLAGGSDQTTQTEENDKNNRESPRHPNSVPFFSPEKIVVSYFGSLQFSGSPHCPILKTLLSNAMSIWSHDGQGWLGWLSHSQCYLLSQLPRISQSSCLRPPLVSQASADFWQNYNSDRPPSARNQPAQLFLEFAAET